MIRLILFLLLLCAYAGVAQESDIYLKNAILINHHRHTPEVIIIGNEVVLVYTDVQWSKDPAFSDKWDALELFRADYAQLKINPKHHIHEYFHVVNYCTWSHQIIGECTITQKECPVLKQLRTYG